MAMYELRGILHKRAWRKGDLEAEDALVSAEAFTTRKAANNALIAKGKEFASRGYERIKIKTVGRGDKDSELIAFTGDTWIHENTGDKHEEYYWYRVIKKK